MARQRILIVDDHEVVRLGLRSLLERHPDFEVVAEAGNGREAIEKVEAYQPDVVVLDIRLPGMSGVEVCQQITDKYPNVHVIMLTSYAEDEMLFAAIRAGAAGYVLKQIGGDDLTRAIEAVGRGEALLDPMLTQRVFEEVRKVSARRRLPPSVTSPTRRCRYCSSSARARQTAKSPKRCTWARALSATMSATSSASSAWQTVPRQQPMPFSTT